MNERFRIIALPIQLSNSTTNIGRANPAKALLVLRNAARASVFFWRNKPSLVYFTIPPHGGGFYANVPLIWLVKLSGAPLLYHVHGKGIAAAAAKSRVYSRLFAWAMKDADVIFLSERLYPDAAVFVQRQRALFLPNALTAPPQPLDDSARDGRHILFLSNLLETKGPLVVLEAFALLQSRGVQFRASVAGAPAGAITREYLERRILEKRLEKRVRYLGQVTGAAKDALLKSADILAFPTANDAFPLVVLEAMGAGLAVVATAEGAIPDMLRDGENGILVPHHHPERLADALQRLLEDSALCRQMGKRGFEIVTTEYARDTYHRRMQEIWNSVAERIRTS